MEASAINATRQILTKFKKGRVDLDKKDGKTKDRVEGWRKNLHALTKDIDA